jgi:uncharacterized protein (DUF305 family)
VYASTVLTLRHSLFAVLVAGLAAGTASAQPQDPQEPPIIQPGAPGQPSKAISAAAASDVSKLTFSPADVTFMQGMIGHHAQAVEMVALLKTHTDSPDMQKLGERITLSQEDEIKFMRHWLEARGQDVPSMHAMHMHGAHLMPGMLTPPEMEQLAAAHGREFDRLFLEGMIKHHGGALTMVKELFAAPGAGQDSEIFAFASDVDIDQRMEIDRMRGMLKELTK